MTALVSTALARGLAKERAIAKNGTTSSATILAAPTRLSSRSPRDSYAPLASTLTTPNARPTATSGALRIAVPSGNEW